MLAAEHCWQPGAVLFRAQLCQQVMGDIASCRGHGGGGAMVKVVVTTRARAAAHIYIYEACSAGSDLRCFGLF